MPRPKGPAILPAGPVEISDFEFFLLFQCQERLRKTHQIVRRFGIEDDPGGSIGQRLKERMGLGWVFCPQKIDGQIGQNVGQNDVRHPFPVGSGDADIDVVATLCVFALRRDDGDGRFEIIFRRIGVVRDEEHAAGEGVDDFLHDVADVIGAGRELVEDDQIERGRPAFAVSFRSRSQILRSSLSIWLGGTICWVVIVSARLCPSLAIIASASVGPQVPEE